MKHIRLIHILISLLLIGNSNGQESRLPYEILYINSYHPGFSWSEEITQGLLDFYHQKNDSFQIYTEYMDAKRHPAKMTEQWFHPYLKNKYKNKRFDLILASDNAALDYVVHFKNDSLLKGIPILFCGISNPEDYPIDELNLFGVIETNSFIQSFELIREIYPDFDTLYAMLDRTETGIVYKKQTDKFFRKYPQYTVEYIDSIYLNNAAEITSKLTNNNIIFYYGISIDGAGYAVDHFQMLEKMSEAATIPLFSSYIIDKEGPLGGRYSSGVDHGYALAKMAKDYLTDVPIPNRVIFPPAHSIIDYSKLKKYKLNPKSIPEESLIINKPENLLHKYKNYIIWNFAFITFLVISIFILFRVYKLQKRSKVLMKVARDKAFESDQLKSSFLANVSHELRTPLNAICGFTELAQTWNNQRDLDEYLDLIYTNSELLAQLVNDLLDISMLDASALKISKTNINLNKLILNLKHQAASLLKSNNKEHIKLKIETNDNFKHLHGDILRISQVMLNYINNAIKYSESGTITIGFDHIQNNTIAKDKFPTINSALVFYVSDTGVGIDEDKHNYVFDRFRRVDSKYKSQHGGVGLGLNIARSLIELMGGEVYMNSKKGVGSIFGFYLPL